MENPPTVAVLMPTYNEINTISPLIDSLQNLQDIDLQIIVIDDGSTDGTAEAVQELTSKHDNITLIERGEKLGLGSAIRDGFKAALNQTPPPDFIVTMDADLSHDPHLLPSMIEECDRDTLVIGSRYIDGGEIHGWSPYRKTVSWGANLLARTFANIPAKDCTSGYRCYGSDLIKAILPSLESTGFDVQIEILSEAARQGFEIVETPINFQDRTTGESKLKTGQIWEFAKRIYNLFSKSDEWKRIIKFGIVGLSGLIINEVILWTLTENIGLYYLHSGMISAEIAVLNNFIWNDRWTFQDRTRTSNQSLPNRFIKFHISRYSGLIIGFIFFAFLTEIMKIHYLYANVSSVMMILAYDYLTSKGWVWS